MSRDAPPPLPGGYKVGEKVFYTWASETVPSGDKVVHGQQGEVVGPGSGEDGDKRVHVRFPGNKGIINLLLTDVRRLRAASAATPRLRPARATLPTPRACVPATASAAASQPSLHAQPRAPQPTAWVREGWWPWARCGLAASVTAAERAAAEPYLLTPAGGCVRR